MNRNTNLSPLPFYATIDEQVFRRCYAYGQVFPLIAPKNRFLPFQIFLKDLYDIEIKVTLYNFEGTVSRDITTIMHAAGLTYTLFEMNGTRNCCIIFPGIADMDVWKEFGLDFNRDFRSDSFGGEYSSGEGRAYLAVSVLDHNSGVTTDCFSEVMTLVSDVSGCLKLQWYSLKDLEYSGGCISYEHSPYCNIMYVRSDIGMPTYDFREEGEDRNGNYFATKQISEKVFHFCFLATEQMCDALRIMGLSDVAIITDSLGREYLCDSFLMSPEWQPQGYLAEVKCEFQTDTMVVQPAKVINTDEIRPEFYTGAQKTVVIYHSEQEETVEVVNIFPILPGLRLYSPEKWIDIEKLSNDRYKITLRPGENLKDAFIYANSDYGKQGLLKVTILRPTPGV